MHTIPTLAAGLTLALSTLPVWAGAEPVERPQPPASAQSQTQASVAPAGVSSWAFVSGNGALGRNRNATGATHLSTGKYQVDFNSNVRLCGYTATIAGKAGIPAPALIVVAHRKGVPNAVFVGTFDTLTLLPADHRFSLNVAC